MSILSLKRGIDKSPVAKMGTNKTQLGLLIRKFRESIGNHLETKVNENYQVYLNKITLRQGYPETRGNLISTRDLEMAIEFISSNNTEWHTQRQATLHQDY